MYYISTKLPPLSVWILPTENVRALPMESVWIQPQKARCHVYEIGYRSTKFPTLSVWTLPTENVWALAAEHVCIQQKNECDGGLSTLIRIHAISFWGQPRDS